jgi:hypothetical protein
MVTRRLGTATALVWTMWALSCSVGPDGSFLDLQPLVFPSQGALGPTEEEPGSTIAVVIDSNYIEPGDIGEDHAIDGNRIWAVLRKGTTTADVWGRAVLSLQAPPNSRVHYERPGASFTVLLFDLPPSTGEYGFDPGLPYPYTATLDVYVDETLVHQPRIVITGEDGASNEIIDSQFLSPEGLYYDLAPRPTLRLRPKRAPGTFAPGQPSIGAIQFTFAAIEENCALDVRVHPAGEAANATTIVGPEYDAAEGGGQDRYDVVLADPKGIALSYLSDLPGFDTTDETLASQGPIVDISFDFGSGELEDPCEGFSDPGTFSIRDLRVYDVDGNLMFVDVGNVVVDTTAAPDPAAVLRMYSLSAVPVER